MKFREDKASQAAALLLQLGGGRMNHMKLIKLLYLADRDALLRFGRPITFDHYYSLPHGPILSFTLDLVNSDRDPESPSYWDELISERQGHEVALRSSTLETVALSDAERQVLEDVSRDYGSMDQWQLRDLTHTLPEWQDPQGSRVPISIDDILQGEGYDSEDIEAILETLEAEQLADRVWT